MRKWLATLLALLLALSALGAAAETVDGMTPIAFPELNFTAEADFDRIAQTDEGHELFLYTGVTSKTASRPSKPRPGASTSTPAATQRPAPDISALVPQPTAAKEPLMSCTVTEIPFAGMPVGHCVAPKGWKVNYQLTSGNSLEASWLLKLVAAKPEGDIAMSYASTQIFVQILRDDTGIVHQDNVYNPLYHATLLTYMNAPAYCDYLARQRADGDLTLVEDNQFPEAAALFRQKEQELLAEGNKYAGISNVGVKNPEFSVCYRRYATEIGSLPVTICAMTGIQKIETYAFVPGLSTLSTNMIGWKPVFSYTVICPTEEWDIAEPIFLTFIENTSASDQLVAANKRMADELLDISSSTSENVLRAEASRGDTYEDRFSDYLFDANDYTLDDGTHVKVSTAYDYVYEGDNGNVYFSDSAFAQPGGSVQLYPNR